MVESGLPYLVGGKARGWFEIETIGVGLVNAKHTGQDYKRYKAGYTPDGSSGKGEYFEVKSKVNGVFYTDSFKAR